MALRAAIGDIHLSGFESDPLDDEGLPMRLGIIMRTLDYIISVLRDREIYEVDMLGDLINDKSIIYTVAQDAFKDFLSRNSDIQFRLISGNHDLSSTGTTQRSAIDVFDSYDNVECISKTPVQIGNIVYVPFTHNFMDAIIDIEPTDILISHLGLNEAMLQSGLSKVDKLTMNDVATRFRLALLGHYHAPQHLSNGNIHVWYAGNIIHKNWNDKVRHDR